MAEGNPFRFEDLSEEEKTTKVKKVKKVKYTPAHELATYKKHRNYILVTRRYTKDVYLFVKSGVSRLGWWPTHIKDSAGLTKLPESDQDFIFSVYGKGIHLRGWGRWDRGRVTRPHPSNTLEGKRKHRHRKRSRKYT